MQDPQLELDELRRDFHEMRTIMNKQELELNRLIEKNRFLEKRVTLYANAHPGRELGTLTMGTVVGVDQDGHPAAVCEMDSPNYAMVQVRVWHNEADYDDMWCRVAQPWAMEQYQGSPGRYQGISFLPRVGDEVLLAFLGWHTALTPVVVGYLPGGGFAYPVEQTEGTLAQTTDAQGAPHNPLSSNRFKNVIRTASTEGVKHEIAFVDQPGQEELTMATEGDLRVYAKGDHYQHCENNYIKTVKGDSNTNISGDTVTIHQGDHTYTVYGTSKTEHKSDERYWNWGDTEELFLGAKESVVTGHEGAATAGAFTKVDAGLSSEFKLGGMTDVKLGGGLDLKAGSFKSGIFGNHIETFAGSKINNVTGSVIEVMSGQTTRFVTGLEMEFVDGVKSISNTVTDEDGEVRLEEIQAHIGTHGLEAMNVEVRNHDAAVDMISAGLHIIT